MTPAGFYVRDERCHGCSARGQCWWTSTGHGFRAYCRECWDRLVGVLR